MTVVHLGSFTLNIDTLELSKAGRPIHLPAQPARLLALLISRAPAVVSRDEIRRVLWGDALHVEFDSAVNACISQIRTALNDNARAPRFIETVPRRGYRCLIERVADRGDEATLSHLPVRSGRRTTAIVGILSTTFVALIGVFVWSVSAAPRPAPAINLAALQAFERGVSGLADAGPSELVARVKYFESAVAADRDFAAAYAGLADAKLLLGAYRVEPPQIAYAAAKAAAQSALRLDDSLAEAHASFGAALLSFDWDWRGAREHLARAVALNDRSPRVQLWWSRYLTAAGDHRAAVAAANRAVALAPGSPSAMTQLGIANYYARQFADAEAACGTAARMMREFLPAVACAEAAAARGERSPNLLLAPAIELVRAGERERAIDWLQRAANRRSDGLLLASVDPALTPLRGDARFMALLQRVGHPRAQP